MDQDELQLPQRLLEFAQKKQPFRFIDHIN
jgi:hypothetical protein